MYQPMNVEENCSKYNVNLIFQLLPDICCAIHHSTNVHLPSKTGVNVLIGDGDGDGDGNGDGDGDGDA